MCNSDRIRSCGVNEEKKIKFRNKCEISGSAIYFEIEFEFFLQHP